MHTYATTKKLKNKAFAVKSQNMIQAVRIRVAFISENKFQKELFLIGRWPFFQRLLHPFSALVRMAMCIRIPRLKTKKEGYERIGI